ncbi:unnamed protein product, partial [Polarella glacialis]
EFLGGRSVLELGCGVAPLPIAVAASRGAGECQATDYSESIVGFAEANLALNGIDRVVSAVLDWEKVVSAAASGAVVRKWDVVLFADTVYTEEMGTLLAECIDAVLAPEGQVLGALPPLRVGTAEFVLMMRKHGFAAEELECSQVLKDAIDDSSILESDSLKGEALLDVIHGRPVAQCVMVRWRRGPVEKDDSQKIWSYLAGIMAQADLSIKMSEGFEVWE